MAVGEVDLVDADDPDGALLALLIGGRDRGPEEDLVGLAAPGRVDDLGVGQALAQVADPPVDLAQALLAVDVVAVLRAVAVARIRAKPSGVM
jgi:hypothetical protein